ncbi:hypothetical protein U9M48_018444 [Paspalum notatum var. saurae]|uniref:Reverse transcriptase zinc-binding domain-containing protein n=1 Tax=Paspalum notatum var. saurae TaxID=547442 RepID=A0AAQ3TCU8_PASNO
MNDDGVWQQLLRKKYLKNKTIGKVKWKPGDSHFWSGLMKVKDHFLNLSIFNLHNGTQCRFWEDKWFENVSLKDQFSSLYNITRKKHISVATVFSVIPINVSYRRALVGHNLIKWNELVAKIAFVQLDNQHDSVNWILSKQGTFSVQTIYRYLVNQIAVPLNKSLWKLRLPLKNKIFNWFVLKGVILTKNNLLKRRWKGDDHRCFCDNKETIQHLFFDCHVASRLQGYLLGLFLEFVAESEQQAFHEVSVSGGRNNVHGRLQEARMALVKENLCLVCVRL